jgi:hemerythrin superfamily protein
MATSKKKAEMTAIDLLESQHREVEDLFEQLEDAESDDECEQLFVQLADKLAMHAKIEETHFYPAVRANRTEEILDESLEEHLAIKRVLADLIAMELDDDTFDAKLKVLQEEVEHHVDEEENELFPKVRNIFSDDELIAIGQEMMAMQAELEDKDPRLEVPKEVAAAAPPTT